MTIKSKCTSVQISNITKVCSKCPPCAAVQARSRGRNCAWSLHRWTPSGKCSHSFDQRDFSWSTSRIRLRCFPHVSQCTGFRSGLLADHRAGAMKSGVSQVNGCMVSCAQRHVDNTGRSPLYLDQWRTSQYATDCSQQPTPSPIARSRTGFSLNVTSGQRCIGNRYFVVGVCRLIILYQIIFSHEIW